MDVHNFSTKLLDVTSIGHALHICDGAWIGHTNSMTPSVKPRHKCCSARSCDTCLCRCRIKYRWWRL